MTAAAVAAASAIPRLALVLSFRPIAHRWVAKLAKNAPAQAKINSLSSESLIRMTLASCRLSRTARLVAIATGIGNLDSERICSGRLKAVFIKGALATRARRE